jgi:acyl dehydratase
VPINPEFVGRTYPATGTYLVGREKIREFAAAVGDQNPASNDVAAARALGYADLIAPPTFAIVLSMRAQESLLFDPELGLDYTRVVHGEQKFAYARPITAGDELVVTSTIESIRTMAGNDMITTRADMATVGGEHVASATTLLISRGPEEEQ